MKTAKVVACAMLSLALGLLGCSGGTYGSSTTGGGAVPASMTGNWQMMATSSVSASTQAEVFAALTSSGTAITGIAHISSPCYSGKEVIPVSGTIDAKGNVAITSGAVTGQTFSFTGTLAYGAIADGAYVVTGGCANGDKGTLVGYIVASVSGTYAGTMSSASGIPIQVSVQVAQLPTADTLGFYHVTGTATVTGSPCFTVLGLKEPEAGIALGTIVGGIFSSPPDPAHVLIVGRLDRQGTKLTAIYQVEGGKCDRDTGQGVLTRQ